MAITKNERRELLEEALEHCERIAEILRRLDDRWLSAYLRRDFEGTQKPAIYGGARDKFLFKLRELDQTPAEGMCDRCGLQPEHLGAEGLCGECHQQLEREAAHGGE